MKISKALFLLSVMITGFVFDNPFINSEELKILTGEKWKGTLTYLDYGKNKFVNIPSDITIVQSAEDSNIYFFEYEYPDEPHANGIDTVVINDEGHKLNDELIIDKKNNDSNNYITLVTQKNGFDNDKKAVLKHTYVISEKKFVIAKFVKYDNENDFFKRNEYSYER
ncbi:MAG: hypothetical protein LH629_08090 [Ignavibacteria bacterium]|nr:hypothetical protein [Ignavibacteria bacterium]